MQAPAGIMLLHRTMVQEAQHRRRHPSLGTGPTLTRILIGRMLIAAGTRLAPAQQSEYPMPAMGALSIAR